MDEVVEATTDATPETPSVEVPAAESETPSVDAQAATDGGQEPPADDVDELLRFARSRGHNDLTDIRARNDLGSFLGRTLTHNRTLSQEIEALKAQLAQRDTPARPATPEPDPEPPPDLKAIDDYISGLKADKETLDNTEKDLSQTLFKLATDIRIQEALIERADPLDKPTLQQQKVLLDRELAIVQRQLDAVPRDRKRVEAWIATAERDRRNTERALEGEESARQQAAKAKDAWNADFVTKVDSLILKNADDLKIPADPKLRAAMAKTVSRLVGWELQLRAKEDIDSVDIAALARSCVQHWAEEHGLAGAVKLAQVSKEKATVAQPAGGSKTAPPPNPDTPKRTPREQMEYEREQRLRKMAAYGY